MYTACFFSPDLYGFRGNTTASCSNLRTAAVELLLLQLQLPMQQLQLLQPLLLLLLLPAPMPLRPAEEVRGVSGCLGVCYELWCWG